MRFFVFLSFCLLITMSSTAQSDLLMLKKNNRTIKTFFPGSPMNFYTDIRYYEAYVTSIARDSVYLIQYDIRMVPTPLGFFVSDTVASYRFSVNYHQIKGFSKPNKNFDWSASGATLLGGGTLLATIGLGTWIFTKPNTRYHASPQLVIGSAALAGIGYLLLKSHHKSLKLGKKYKLLYTKVI